MGAVGRSVAMKYHTTIAAAVLLASQFFTLDGAVADPPPADHRILAQDDAPIVISDYAAMYQPRGTNSREGIRHTLRYRNVSKRRIVALQFGLLAFNVFNEFQDKLGGYAIQDVEPGEDTYGTWLANARAESAFYTGVAYLSKVRFEDGEVWSANLNNITKQVQEIEMGFSVELLHSR